MLIKHPQLLFLNQATVFDSVTSSHNEPTVSCLRNYFILVGLNLLPFKSRFDDVAQWRNRELFTSCFIILNISIKSSLPHLLCRLNPASLLMCLSQLHSTCSKMRRASSEAKTYYIYSARGILQTSPPVDSPSHADPTCVASPREVNRTAHECRETTWPVLTWNQPYNLNSASANTPVPLSLLRAGLGPKAQFLPTLRAWADDMSTSVQSTFMPV